MKCHHTLADTDTVQADYNRVGKKHIMFTGKQAAEEHQSGCGQKDFRQVAFNKNHVVFRGKALSVRVPCRGLCFSGIAW
jgi:hypothetical protein